MRHPQEFVVSPDFLQFEHLLYLQIMALEACYFARLYSIPQVGLLRRFALEDFANHSERFKANLFLVRHDVTIVLHHADDVRVAGVLVLAIEEPLSECFVMPHYVTFVHSDLNVPV